MISRDGHNEAEPLLRQAIDMVSRDRRSGKDPDTKIHRHALGDAWVIVESELLNWISQTWLARAAWRKRNSPRVTA